MNQVYTGLFSGFPGKIFFLWKRPVSGAQREVVFFFFFLLMHDAFFVCVGGGD